MNLEMGRTIARMEHLLFGNTLESPWRLQIDNIEREVCQGTTSSVFYQLEQSM